jgi:hypothetical protein
MAMTVCAGAVTFGAIAGGFVRIDIAELVHAWRTCQDSPPGIGDFRAWLAAHEMTARRQAVGDVRSPSYGVAELAKLLGVAERTAAAAVRRLVAAGLLSWSEHAIEFPAPPDREQIDELLTDTIAGGRGPIAIPRRMLRFLAGGARTALIATALAALLRCLSRRRKGFGATGRFKASWIAKVFGIAARHAKAARAELVALGWLEPQPGEQWAWNRWGRAYLVRLDWAGPDADRHPHPTQDGGRSSPPDLHPDPLREAEHQEPARPGPTGASLGNTQTDRPATVPDDSPGDSARPSLPAPDLRDIRAEDLADTGRALELHRQAAARGRVGASEADRVRFMAAVEHARAVGRGNPPGLLARIVSSGWWHLLTQGDEDRAARRLREHDRPAVTPALGWRSYVGEAVAGSACPRPSPAPTRRSSFVPDGPSQGPRSLSDALGRLVGRGAP